MGNLCKRRISPIQLENIAFHLSAFKRTRRSLQAPRSNWILSHAKTMLPAEHVHHQKVVMSVSVDIGKIDAHGEGAGTTQGQTRQGAEASLPVIDPYAIG